MKFAMRGHGTVACIISVRYVSRSPSMVRAMRLQLGHVSGLLSVLQRRFEIGISLGYFELATFSMHGQ